MGRGNPGASGRGVKTRQDRGLSSPQVDPWAGAGGGAPSPRACGSGRGLRVGGTLGPRVSGTQGLGAGCGLRSRAGASP